jgi:hypothetical protein
MSKIFLKATAAAAAMLAINSASAATAPIPGTYSTTAITTDAKCGGAPAGSVAGFIFNLVGTGKTGEYANVPVATTTDPELVNIVYSSAFPTASGIWKGTETQTLITDSTKTKLPLATFTSTVTFNDANTFFVDYSDSTGCTANQTSVRVGK